MPRKTKRAVQSFFSILKKVKLRWLLTISAGKAKLISTSESKCICSLLMTKQHKLKMMHSAKILMILFGSPHR